MNTEVKTKLSDEILVYEFLNGDQFCMGILYDRYYPKVYHRCLAFVKNRNDAFDLAQDILLKTFINISSFKGSSKFSTWLFSITHNHCISQVEKTKKVYYQTISSDYYIMAPDFQGEAYQERIRKEELELKLDEYLERLPESDRKMLELKYRFDYSVKDLQDEFELSASAIKMRLLRARQKIERIITEREVA